MCHELNLFLKKRDPDFFETVIRPLLNCKMEKTFVDFYLLKDFQEINKYKDFYCMQKLNAMEKCLLIDSLMQQGDISLAT